MTLTILLFQIAVPVALLGWLFLLPTGSASGLVVQITGAGTLLFALARVAQWAVPVWWLPLVYGAL